MLSARCPCGGRSCGPAPSARALLSVWPAWQPGARTLSLPVPSNVLRRSRCSASTRVTAALSAKASREGGPSGSLFSCSLCPAHELTLCGTFCPFKCPASTAACRPLSLSVPAALLCGRCRSLCTAPVLLCSRYAASTRPCLPLARVLSSACPVVGVSCLVALRGALCRSRHPVPVLSSLSPPRG